MKQNIFFKLKNISKSKWHTEKLISGSCKINWNEIVFYNIYYLPLDLEPKGMPFDARPIGKL